MSGIRWFEALREDVRYAFRVLRKAPGFAVVSVLTLALGIGANTAIFTVVNTVLLRPLPYPDSSRIVQINRQDGDGDSMPMLAYWLQSNPGFLDLTAYDGDARSMSLAGVGHPELVRAMKVSRNYFRLFGANPILGRTFSPEEDEPGGQSVAVVSYGLWQRRFGGDPSILGRTITLGGAPCMVIGVLSPRFRPYPAADIWLALQADPNSTDQAHIYTVSGRLPSGAMLSQANSWMALVGKRYVATHPEQLGNDGNLKVESLQEQLTGPVRPALLILLGAVGLVLLIACANVANLLLARGAGRQREIAVRAAVGAGRARIVRQLVTESLVLSAGGGILGLALASWSVRALLAFAPENLPRVAELAAAPALDVRVAAFAILLSVVTGVVFGLLPALQISKTNLSTTLKEQGRAGDGGRKRNRTRDVLVAGEMAIAVILLCGAMLLVRSFIALHRVEPGFDSRSLLTLQISLDGPKYANATSVDQLGRQVTTRLESIPGVQTAALTNGLPLGEVMDMIFDIPGRPPLEGYKFTGDVLWTFVSPHYFAALRIPLLSGRLPGEQEPLRTVVINQAMARRFWPGENPVGQTILIGAGLGPKFDQGPCKIVGIVGDVRDRLEWPAPPAMYQVFSQVPDAAIGLVFKQMSAGIVVRTKTGVDAMSVSQAIRQALLAGDLQLPVASVETMDQRMMESTGEAKFNLLLLSVFGAIALLLAAVGVYGVISHSTERRTHEIGIRMALGAQKADVLKMVMRHGMALAVSGGCIGIVAAFGFTRLMGSLLYGVKPTDPMTFILVPATLVGVALLACYLPARRAMRIEPAEALRQE